MIERKTMDNQDKKPNLYSYIILVIIVMYMFVEHFVITAMLAVALIITHIKDKLKSESNVPQWIHSACLKCIREHERR